MESIHTNPLYNIPFHTKHPTTKIRTLLKHRNAPPQMLTTSSSSFHFMVPRRERRSEKSPEIRISYFAATGSVSSNGVPTRTSETNIKAMQFGKSSSALELLDLERGVCIPFRKYSPETVLANRPDIIREDYMNELCILQHDVPSFPNQIAFNIIEEELGQPLEAVFSRISSETIAAASLGQVYRATLRATGEDIAIKVQRPEIEPIIYQDLFLFRTLASFLNGVSLQKLGCNAELLVDEFGEKLLEELDYTLLLQELPCVCN